jgi:hypothetical protein
MCVYLTDVHLMGIYLTGMHLMGTYLIGIRLIKHNEYPQPLLRIECSRFT